MNTTVSTRKNAQRSLSTRFPSIYQYPSVFPILPFYLHISISTCVFLTSLSSFHFTIPVISLLLTYYARKLLLFYKPLISYYVNSLILFFYQFLSPLLRLNSSPSSLFSPTMPTLAHVNYGPSIYLSLYFSLSLSASLYLFLSPSIYISLFCPIYLSSSKTTSSYNSLCGNRTRDRPFHVRIPNIILHYIYRYLH